MLNVSPTSSFKYIEKGIDSFCFDDLLDSTNQLTMTNLTAAKYAHLCDLFSFLITHHSFRSKYVVLSSNLSSKLASLITLDKFKFLQLSSIRFFRSCLNKQDEFYNRCLIKHDLFGPVLEVLERQRGRDNLVGSACLEFFENIRLVCFFFFQKVIYFQLMVFFFGLKKDES